MMVVCMQILATAARHAISGKAEEAEKAALEKSQSGSELRRLSRRNNFGLNFMAKIDGDGPSYLINPNHYSCYFKVRAMVALEQRLIDVKLT